MQHTCYCGKVYDCPWCGTPDSFICPTINDDEDGNMCDTCLDNFAADYQAAFYSSEED